jgi:hypothetical protein
MRIRASSRTRKGKSLCALVANPNALAAAMRSRVPMPTTVVSSVKYGPITEAKSSGRG